MTCFIVGSGHRGAQVAISLRQGRLRRLDRHRHRRDRPWLVGIGDLRERGPARRQRAHNPARRVRRRRLRPAIIGVLQYWPGEARVGEIGQTVPIHAGSTGKALLAFVEPGRWPPSSRRRTVLDEERSAGFRPARPDSRARLGGLGRQSHAGRRRPVGSVIQRRRASSARSPSPVRRAAGTKMPWSWRRRC